jgi:DNA-binding response OmpR family regulator
MPRPTILIAEPEPNEALSLRKLVLETAKYNVLTAHSTQEALDLFRLFPNVNAAVMVMSKTIDCEKIAESIKNHADRVIIIMLSPVIGATCDGADFTLSSHEPEQLVALMRSQLGDPKRD